MPQRPPKRWFDRCTAAVIADDPKALCGWIWHHHMRPERKAEIMAGAEFDPKKDPAPRDITMRALTLIRAVPEVDDLLEVAIYCGSRYDAVMEHLKDTKLDEIEGGRVRRGRKNKATNIFIYR